MYVFNYIIYIIFLAIVYPHAIETDYHKLKTEMKSHRKALEIYTYKHNEILGKMVEKNQKLDRL